MAPFFYLVKYDFGAAPVAHSATSCKGVQGGRVPGSIPIAIGRYPDIKGHPQGWPFFILISADKPF